MFPPFDMPACRTRRLKRLLFMTVMFIPALSAGAATRRWTGGAGDGLWASAANWNGNSLPGTADEVVLDNSLLAADYTVTLPGTAVRIKTLTLSPAAAHVIQLILPSTNLVAPALTVDGPGYGILINSGGIFRNESGLSTGASLSIADSIRINNGGRYVHRSRSPSASSIVQYLSKAPGTEKGIFEYDVPGGANYDVSVTRRVYGTLVFSAAAAGTPRNYTGSGASQLTVNGNLVINNNATLRLDLSGASGNVVVSGDYIQNGGSFNIGYGANNTVVKIAGQLLQSPGATITETDAGFPVIELNGATRQNISLQGSLTNNIVFRLNNPTGALLQSPLSLPYKLELADGVLTTSAAGLLTLGAGCTVAADSSSANSYIDGPLRKEGLSGTPYFLFPVGKGGAQQWAALKNATGHFTVEYIKTDPHRLGNSYDTSIAAISSLGYWSITADALPAPAAAVSLAYTGPNNAGIADMANARIAQLSAGSWTNRGNTGYTGSAGATGSVSSDWLQPFPAATGYFTIAAHAAERSLSVNLPAAPGRRGPAATALSVDCRVTPFAGGIALHIKAARKTRLHLALLTIAGVQVKTLPFDAPAGSASLTIDWGGLQAGFYILLVQDDRGLRITHPLLKW